jgi:hypothetical protein
MERLHYRSTSLLDIQAEVRQSELHRIGRRMAANASTKERVAH